MRDEKIPRIKIAVDPRLAQRYGAEISWAWRTLLAGAGYAWEEVTIDDPECDIAYTDLPPGDVRSRMLIRVNREAWDRMRCLRLARVDSRDGWELPTYEGESPHPDWFHTEDGAFICQRDIVLDFFWLMTGQEERHFPRNVHGHLNLEGTAQLRELVTRRAPASGIAVCLEQTLVDLGLPPAHPRWPDGKRAAASISHDVDYPEVMRWLEPLRILRRRSLHGVSPALSVLLGRRCHWQFESWVEMERSLNARSAFYFSGRKGSLREYAAGTPDPFYEVRSRRFRELFGYLRDEGFEIGMHASYRAYESLDQFEIEKRTLEGAAGIAIEGNRHHYWHMHPHDLESTLLLHEQAGLTYDASLAHEYYVGWRHGSTWPYFPFHQQERRAVGTLQLPTAWMDNQLFGHSRHNPGDRLDILHSLTETVVAQGGFLLVDVHEYVYDEILFPDWSGTLRSLWESLASHSCIWFGTPLEVACHWRDRYDAIFDSSRGLAG